MNVLGSVFLGDAARHRVYSPTASSPPTSPVPNPTSASAASNSKSAGDSRPPIDPELSLELRIRWLECLLYGVRQDTRSSRGRKSVGGSEKEREGKTEVLVLKAEEVQRKLDRIVHGNDGLRKFMDRCA